MKETEKIMMEVTKDEAMYILQDRISDKWYVDLEPVFILAPGSVIAYFLYTIVSENYNDRLGVVVILPVLIVCFLLFWRLFKKRQKIAERLYQETVSQNQASKTEKGDKPGV